MRLVKQVQEATRYVWEGVKRIFSPRDDEYPETGVQPFTGDPYKDKGQH